MALLMLLSIMALPLRIQANTPSIYFSEIAWAGSSLSSSDEWIELTNVGDTPIDISGWTLKGAASSEADLVIPDESVIQPHSTYVIANYEHTHEKSSLAITPDFVSASVSLSNSGFRLYLYDDANTLIDMAGNEGPPIAGRSGSTASTDDGRYRSMVRVDGLMDGSQESSWVDAATSGGFKYHVEDYGTPGSAFFEDVVMEESVPEKHSTTPEENSNTSTEDQPLEEPEDPTSSEENMEESNSTDVTTSIVINEFVSDPHEGEPEWIELYNSTDEHIDLTGWTIEDATGKQTVLEETLETKTFTLINNPAGKLNNSGDVIILKNNSGDVIDVVEYGTDELPAAKDGASLARNIAGVFEHTYAPTPGATNVFESEKPEEPASEEAAEEDNQATEISDTNTNIVHVNEFVVDPHEGESEWIELYNPTSTRILLEGWIVEDESGKTTDLSDMSIESEEYLIIESPKGKLNNGGDSVILKNSEGEIVDSVTYGGEGYPAPKDGDALARNGDAFEVTQITTPGRPNLFFVAVTESEPSSEDLSSKTDTDASTPQKDSPDSTSEDTEETHPTESETESVDSSMEEKTAPILKTLKLVTLYPNTVGADEVEEFIEIKNTGSETVVLDDWKLEDGSTKQYTFDETVFLLPDQTMKFLRPQTKITLNNTGDTLELIAPDGDVVDKVTYGNSAKGSLYVYKNGYWMWETTATTADTTAVPSTTNAEPETTSAQQTVSVSSKTSYESASVLSIKSIQEVKQEQDDRGVKTIGQVTVAPSVYGTQTFYIQDETGGIQMYLHSGNFPALHEGDVIQVTGTLSTSRGERRIKLADATGIVSSNATVSVSSKEQYIAMVDQLYVGELLTIEGVVQSKSSTKLVLESAGETMTIYLKTNPAIDPNQFSRGDELSVTGILTVYDGELRLRPRSEKDIVIKEAATTIATSSSVTPSEPTQNMGLILLYATLAALGGLALWKYLPRRKTNAVAV